MRPKRPVRPPPTPPPPPAVVKPEDLAAINTPEVDKLPAYISVGKFQWKPPLPGPKGDTGEPGAPGAQGEPGPTARPITPPIETAEIGDGQVTPEKLSFTPSAVGVFVPRDCTAGDITSGLTMDNTRRNDGIDLSAIVPVGAIAVLLRMYVGSYADYGVLTLIANDTTKSENRLICPTNADIGIPHVDVIGIMSIDADRLIDYQGSPVINAYGIYVLGWFI